MGKIFDRIDAAPLVDMPEVMKEFWVYIPTGKMHVRFRHRPTGRYQRVYRKIICTLHIKPTRPKNPEKHGYAALDADFSITVSVKFSLGRVALLKAKLEELIEELAMVRINEAQYRGISEDNIVKGCDDEVATEETWPIAEFEWRIRGATGYEHLNLEFEFELPKEEDEK